MEVIDSIKVFREKEESFADVLRRLNKIIQALDVYPEKVINMTVEKIQQGTPNTLCYRLWFWREVKD